MNALVQVLVLISGLLMNFAFPVLFGLEAYGIFLQSVLLTLVCHRLIDIVAEPLIALVPEERFFATSLTFNLCLGCIVWAVSPLLGFGIVDVPLLFGMLGSSSVMLSLHRLRRLRALVVYLIVFNTSFVVLALYEHFAGASGPGLRGILLLTNVAGFIIGFAMLARISRWRGDFVRTLLEVTRTAAVQMPIALGSTLIFSFLTTIFPLLCVPVLDAAALARLRVLISIAQASISAFPVNIKAIFVAMHASGAEARLVPLLRVAFWYFFVATCVVAVLAELRPTLGAYASVAAVMITFFWMVCLERYLLALGLRKRLVVLNITGFLALCSASLWVNSLDEALLVYCLGVGLYATLLIVIGEVWRFASLSLVFLPAVVSAIVLGSVTQIFDVLPALLGLGVAALVFCRLRRDDWGVLVGRI